MHYKRIVCVAGMADYVRVKSVQMHKHRLLVCFHHRVRLYGDFA
jgi:hypothetical protein